MSFSFSITRKVQCATCGADIITKNRIDQAYFCSACRPVRDEQVKTNAMLRQRKRRAAAKRLQ